MRSAEGHSSKRGNYVGGRRQTETRRAAKVVKGVRDPARWSGEPAKADRQLKDLVKTAPQGARYHLRVEFVAGLAPSGRVGATSCAVRKT